MEYYLPREKNKYCYMQKIWINIEKTSHKRVNSTLFHLYEVKKQASESTLVFAVEWLGSWSERWMRIFAL